MLIVVCTLKGVRFVLVCAHALTSVSPDEEIEAWWRQLKSLLSKVPSSCAPLLFLDANARFLQQEGRSATEDSVPANFNAACLRSFSTDIGVRISAQQDQEGRFFHSWCSPKGTLSLIDYICCPTEWAVGHTTIGNVDLDDLHADHDHLPVHTTLEAQVSVVNAAERPRVDVQALSSAQGRTLAANAVAAAPIVPWQETCTAHVEAVQESLVGSLGQCDLHANARPRHPAVTWNTLELVRHRRHQRRVLKIVAARSDTGFLHLCFCAWRNGRPPADEVYRNAKAARYNMARCYHTLHLIDRDLRTAMQRDKAEFRQSSDSKCKSSRASRVCAQASGHIEDGSQV